jgi:hypothetical protein
MQASGIIERVKPRQIAGGKTAYSFLINDVWYGTYTNEPPAEGSAVEFEYAVNKAGFNNVDYKTLKVTEAASAATASAPAPGTARANFNNKDANIQWQSARNAAVPMIIGAVQAGVIKADSLEALQILVNAQTVDFFDASMEVGVTGTTPADLVG